MSVSSPRVSVVFATRDRSRRLVGLLDSLRSQTLEGGEFEVIAVDDGSRDETPAVLAAAARTPEPAITVVTRAASGGAATARNDGWERTRAPLVAFIDDDCEASPTWLEEGIRAWERSPGAIVQGRTEPIDRELDRLGPFSRTLTVRELGPFFHTCNIFYPREVLDLLRGFDAERFSAAGGEDADLAWRAIEAGFETRFADRAVVGHAVEDLGPIGHLRLALRWSDTMAMFRHRELRRRALTAGIFWKRSHAALPAAALALLVVRRWPIVAALLLAPYARELAARLRPIDARSPWVAACLTLHDGLEMFAAVRGGVRHRVLVI